MQPAQDAGPVAAISPWPQGSQAVALNLLQLWHILTSLSPPPFTPDKELTTLSSGYFAQDSHLPASKKQQNTFPSLQFSKII